MKHQLIVKGMHCASCKTLIQEALEDAGAKQVHIALDEKKQTGVVTLESSKTKAELTKTIKEQGAYSVQ